MSNKYKFGNNEKLYFVSFSIVYWIDLFIRNEYKQILISSWNYCKDNKGLEIYGWCIMTSHVHMIIGSSQNNLSDIYARYEKVYFATAKEYNNKPSTGKQKGVVIMDDETGW